MRQIRLLSFLSSWEKRLVDIIWRFKYIFRVYLATRHIICNFLLPLPRWNDPIFGCHIPQHDKHAIEKLKKSFKNFVVEHDMLANRACCKKKAWSSAWNCCLRHRLLLIKRLTLEWRIKRAAPGELFPIKLLIGHK